MRQPLTLDGTRLFARIHSIDFECPRCGEIHSIKQGRRHPGWNPRTGTQTCTCGLSVQLGVLLYPTTAGKPPAAQIPEDWIPTPRQSAAIRQLLVGIHLAERHRRPRGPHARNVAGPPCTCVLEPGNEAAGQVPRVVRHPGCPIHAGAPGLGGFDRPARPGDPDNLGESANLGDFE